MSEQTFSPIVLATPHVDPCTFPDADCTCRAIEIRKAFLKAADKAAAKRPKVVTLCGSTRFYEEFQQANYDLTMNGHIVLSVGFYPHAKAESGHGEGVGHDSAEKVRLDELHMRKIDLSDWVYVLDVDGYIGESTSREIAYAKKRGVPIAYLSKEGSVSPSVKSIPQVIRDQMARIGLKAAKSVDLAQGAVNWGSAEVIPSTAAGPTRMSADAHTTEIASQSGSGVTAQRTGDAITTRSPGGQERFWFDDRSDEDIQRTVDDRQEIADSARAALTLRAQERATAVPATTDDRVEVIARALCKQGEDKEWADISEYSRGSYRDDARAVVAALDAHTTEQES